MPSYSSCSSYPSCALGPCRTSLSRCAGAALPPPYSVAQSEEEAVAKIGDQGYPTLAAAFAAVAEGQTIELLGDYTAVEGEVLTFADSATLDLGGYTLTVPAVVRNANKFIIPADTEVTLTNGKILFPADNGGGRSITVNGTVNVACEIENIGTDESGAVFDVCDGAVVNVGDDAILSSKGTVFWSKKAGSRTINITGGTCTTTSDTGCYTIFYASYAGCEDTINITGGKLVTGGNDIMISASDAVGDWTINCSLDDSCKAKFSNLNGEIADYIADGYEPVLGEDGFYTIQKALPPVAQIGDKKYKTLAEAFASDAAKVEGAKVELLTNVNLTAELDIVDFNGTLDLNGYELTNDESWKAPKVAKNSFDWLIDLYVSDATKTSSLTITNGTVNVKDGHMFYVCAGATLTVAADATIDVTANVWDGDGDYACANPIRTYGKVGGHLGVANNDLVATINVYGTITRNGYEGGCIDQCLGTSVVNVYDGAHLSCAITPDSGWSAYGFKMSGGTAAVNVYGGVIDSGASPFYCYGSCVGAITVKGGEITYNSDGNVFGVLDTTTVSGLGEGCTAKFKKPSNVPKYVDDGYALVKDGDWYVVKQTYTVTLKNGDAVVDTQVVADGQFATNVVLAVEGFKGWTNETCTAAFDFANTPITADITLFAWIEAALPIPAEDLPADISEEDAAKLEETAANLISSGVDAAALKAATTAAKAGTTLTADQQNIINSLLLQSDKLVEGAEVKAASIAIVDGKVTITVEGVNCELPAKTTIGYLTVKHCETVGGDYKAVNRITVTSDGVGTAAALDGNDAAGFYKAEFEWNKPEFEAQ